MHNPKAFLKKSYTYSARVYPFSLRCVCDIGPSNCHYHSFLLLTIRTLLKNLRPSFPAT